jgi:periplasmic divalent cation tolerance protein
MHIAVQTACATEENARLIAKSLVGKGLAASCQCYDVANMHLWQGELCGTSETAVVAKTTMENFEDVRNEILRLHTYELPEIVAFSIKLGNEGYLSRTKG